MKYICILFLALRFIFKGLYSFIFLQEIEYIGVLWQDFFFLSIYVLFLWVCCNKYCWPANPCWWHRSSSESEKRWLSSRESEAQLLEMTVVQRPGHQVPEIRSLSPGPPLDHRAGQGSVPAARQHIHLCTSQINPDCPGTNALKCNV